MTQFWRDAGLPWLVLALALASCAVPAAEPRPTPTSDQGIPVNVEEIPVEYLGERFSVDFSSLGLLFLAGVRVEFEEEHFTNPVPISVPGTVAATGNGAVIVVQLGPDIVADGLPDLTLVDMAIASPQGLGTGSPGFPGVTEGGIFAFLRPDKRMGFLSGTVVSARGDPLSGATVVVPNDMGLKAVSGSDGKFVVGVPLANTPQQVVTVFASHPASPDWAGVHRELVEFMEHSPPSGKLSRPVRLALRSPAPNLLPFKPPDMPEEEIKAKWREVTLRVKAIVQDDIQLLKDMGYDVSSCLGPYEAANASLDVGDYHKAWVKYLSAFQTCTKVPERPPLVPYWYRQLPLLPKSPEGGSDPLAEQKRTEVIQDVKRIVWRTISLMEQGGYAADEVDRVRAPARKGDELLEGGGYNGAWGQYSEAFKLVPAAIKETPEMKEYEPPPPGAIPPPLKRSS